MKFIGDIFSGGAGAGYQAPYAPVMTPFGTPEDPNGLKTNLSNQYNQLGGISDSQNALAQMLLSQAQGGGPNPAAAALQQATNANQAMTAGTIAATKGINPALAARQAAMAGSAQQQQAASQAAQMEAQQQIAARGQLGGLYGQMGQQNLAQQGQLQQAIANLNQSNVANVGQKTSSESKVAAQNASTQGGILSGVGGALGQGLGKLGGSLFGGGAPKKAEDAYDASGGGGMGGGDGFGSSGGPGATMSPYAHGGEVKAPASGPTSKVGQFLHQTLNKGGSVGNAMKAGGKVPGKPEVAGDSLKNDNVKAVLSPGEIVIPRSVVNSKDPAKGAADFVAAVLARGGKSMPAKKGK